MSWLNLYAQAVANLLTDLWLYFLIGFLIAGVVAEFISKQLLSRYLGRNTVSTMIRATLSGTITSVCSCGAIPIAVTMRQGGATRAAALTFMLAAPWAGFVQLVIFYNFLGFRGTAIVFGGALSVAFLAGMVLGRLEDHGWLDDSEPLSTAAACEDSLGDQKPGQLPFQARLVNAGRKGWESFLELWKFLAIGLLLAAVLKAFIPMVWVAEYLGSEASFNPVLTALPIAVAVELCSEGFSIFAGQLHQMGATLPVVFVVVLVGVTTDFTELTVVFGKFGKRCAVGYVVTATTLTVGLALILQWLGV